MISLLDLQSPLAIKEKQLDSIFYLHRIFFGLSKVLRSLPISIFDLPAYLEEEKPIPSCRIGNCVFKCSVLTMRNIRSDECMLAASIPSNRGLHSSPALARWQSHAGNPPAAHQFALPGPRIYKASFNFYHFSKFVSQIFFCFCSVLLNCLHRKQM